MDPEKMAILSRRKNLELMITMDRRRKLGRIEKKIGTMLREGSFLRQMTNRRCRFGSRNCFRSRKNNSRG